ncbi:hypothetical protein ACS0TY_017106 [Phlomoides rotata]
MALPVIKLGSLLVRTISKPIANRLKRAATYHPRFRGLIVDLAQGYHVWTSKMQRHVLGRSNTLEIRPLVEERAVQSATDLLGELFVFSVAGCAIIYEVQRSSRGEAKKEERRKQDLETMKQKNEELAAEVELLKQRIQQLELYATATATHRYWKLRDYQTPSFNQPRVH